MTDFDKRLRNMIADDNLHVPKSLDKRLAEITNTAPRKRAHISVARFALIAAVFAMVGSITAGAAYLITRESMGGYTNPRIIEQHNAEISVAENISPEEAFSSGIEEYVTVTEDMSMQEQFEFSDIPVIMEEEVQSAHEVLSTWMTEYQDESRQKAAEQAAIDAYYQYGFWDAEVEGARFEHVQQCADLLDEQVCEALVVLFLSDGCGYRMHMDCETLELLSTTDLLPEVMADDYFDALWNKSTEEYFSRQNAQG